MNEHTALRIVLSLWFTRRSNMAEYLHTQFGYELESEQEFTRLIIAQTTDGNLDTNNIGGQFAAKWVVDADTLTAVDVNYAWNEMYNTDGTDSYYMTPSFLFCFDGDEILVSERYGPLLKHRIRGKCLGESAGAPKVEWRTIWCSSFN